MTDRTDTDTEAEPWWADLKLYSVPLVLVAMGLIAMAFGVELGGLVAFLGLALIVLSVFA